MGQRKRCRYSYCCLFLLLLIIRRRTVRIVMVMAIPSSHATTGIPPITSGMESMRFKIGCGPAEEDDESEPVLLDTYPDSVCPELSGSVSETDWLFVLETDDRVTAFVGSSVGIGVAVGTGLYWVGILPGIGKVSGCFSVGVTGYR